MKTLRNFLMAAAVALVAMLPQIDAAHAAQQMLCAPDASGAATGARRVTNPTTNVSYQLNSGGCAVIAQTDIGYFLAQGFSSGPSLGTIIYTTGVATSTTDFVIGNIPAGAYIQQIIYSNAVAAAVTGGISIGTTANGTDVVAAQAVGSSALTFTTDALTLKRVFSTTAQTPLHAAAVTAWNSTNVTITVIYGYF
jgi:hypothetical protein